MTENESRLIDLIKRTEKPVEAVQIAVEIIYDYLKQRQSYQ